MGERRRGGLPRLAHSPLTSQLCLIQTAHLARRNWMDVPPGVGLALPQKITRRCLDFTNLPTSQKHMFMLTLSWRAIFRSNYPFVWLAHNQRMNTKKPQAVGQSRPFQKRVCSCRQLVKWASSPAAHYPPHPDPPKFSSHPNQAFLKISRHSKLHHVHSIF